MPKTTKVSVSLPADLYRLAERERKRRRQSRSELFRTALEALLLRARKREAGETSTSQALGRPARERLLRLAGVLGAKDAALMARAVEEGCERVDPRDWR